ncbi:MAG: hypothetical protein DPW09_42770 [Anaerolineae bacterium]|nr:glycosyltransferase [Anaerolineales bacterium]MCQ3980186.1 hypothetical protein [Anaerolineae bacterium]
MDAFFRSMLYPQTGIHEVFGGRKVHANPVEPEPFDLVDLTRDITNATRIYHRRTECVREALAGASLIVTDSQALAQAVQQVLPRSPVVALPFGHFSPLPGEKLPAGEKTEGFTIGLLNHSPEMEMNNLHHLKLLKALDREILLFGEALAGLDAEVTSEWAGFAARCDVLLLPSLPGAINSPTLPLALMETGTAILAHNAPGYYDLDAATGVQLLGRDPAAWRKLLDTLEHNPAKLQAMQERNRAFALRQNRESFVRLAGLVPQFTASLRLPAPTSADCGCAKRKSVTPGNTRRGAPTPDLDQPIIEKEL